MDAHAGGLELARYARSRNPSLVVAVVTTHPQLVAGHSEPLDPTMPVFTKPLEYEAFRDKLRAAVQAMRASAKIAR